MSVTERPTRERLLDGARKIGAMVRAGDRCATAGWHLKSLDKAAPGEVDFGEGDICRCKDKATRFCRAKVQWVMLAIAESVAQPDGERVIVAGDYGFALTMSGKEWDATGLTLTWELAGVGKVKIGAKAE